MLERLLPALRSETLRRWALLAVVSACVCGCQTAHYYRQAIGGEYQILAHREPITGLMARPDTDPSLKRQFELVLQLREFAKTNLYLPINQHYTTYVDLHRRFAVWNVHAAPELSLQPKKWWYPIIGSLKYRGYFSETDARQYADRLVREKDDVYMEGVEAFSTLGWFADPLLSTFIHHAEPDLAEIIFHELTHQRLFLSGDTDFNEAFATTVSEEGVRRWLQARHNPAELEQYQVELHRNRQFVQLIMATRRELEALYGEPEGKPIPHRRLSEQDVVLEREGKARIIDGLRAHYQKLKTEWGNYSGYDHWFSGALNNAQLNTIAVYYDLVPGFEAMLRSRGGDLEPFYTDVKALKKLSKQARHQRLHNWAAGQPELDPARPISYLPID